MFRLQQRNGKQEIELIHMRRIALDGLDFEVSMVVVVWAKSTRILLLAVSSKKNNVM